MKKSWFLLACAALLASATFVNAHPQGPETNEHRAEVHRGDAIAIRGHIRELYPGSRTFIRLRLHNRARRPLTVTSISSRVTDASAGCPSENLTTWRRDLERRIPARSVRRARLRIAMSADAGEACQGAKFPLRYRAKSRR